MGLVGKVYSKFFRTLNDGVFELGYGLSSIKKPERNIVLMYHGVDTIGDNLFNGRHTPLNYFKKQIDFLSKNYNIVSLKDYFERCSSEKKLCCITFDDGYLNNLVNALPILEKYNAKATFFITGINEVGVDILWADFVNIVSKLYWKDILIGGEEFRNKNGNYFSKESKKSLMDIVKNIKPEYGFKQEIFSAFEGKINFKKESKYFEYWKLMNNKQIQLLAQSKCATIGSHGYYHNNLGNILFPNAMKELSNSKKYLENLIQKEITAIGYPDGSYSDEVCNYGASIGIIHQTCSERFNKEEDRKNGFLKNRAGIYNFDSAANQMYAAINAKL